ncbi:hypothetical protein ACQP3J_31540 [Escherichia coli]
MKTFVDLGAWGFLGDTGGQNFLGILYLLEALCALEDLKACFDEILLEFDPGFDDLEFGEKIRETTNITGLTFQVL